MHASLTSYPATRPIYIRIPRPGEKCPYSGLTRSTLLSLVLPSMQQGRLPPVESFVRRQPGARRGIRLVVWTSLEAHIRSRAPFQRSSTSTEAAA
jgi:hypothetical protein